MRAVDQARRQPSTGQSARQMKSASATYDQRLADDVRPGHLNEDSQLASADSEQRSGSKLRAVSSGDLITDQRTAARTKQGSRSSLKFGQKDSLGYARRMELNDRSELEVVDENQPRESTEPRFLRSRIFRVQSGRQNAGPDVNSGTSSSEFQGLFHNKISRRIFSARKEEEPSAQDENKAQVVNIGHLTAS
jgi:hypothetical protein